VTERDIKNICAHVTLVHRPNLTLPSRFEMSAMQLAEWSTVSARHNTSYQRLVMYTPVQTGHPINSVTWSPQTP